VLILSICQMWKMGPCFYLIPHHCSLNPFGISCENTKKIWIYLECLLAIAINTLLVRFELIMVETVIMIEMWCYVVWWKFVSVSENFFYCPADGDRICLWKASELLWDYIASHLRRQLHNSLWLHVFYWGSSSFQITFFHIHMGHSL
jgi:hypothetical protein